MNPTERRRVLILVAGPPRGGNAELANLLRLAQAGRCASPKWDEEANLRDAGHIGAFHRHLFAALDSEWDDPRPIPAARLSAAAESAALLRSCEALLRSFDSGADLVIDDSGLGRLLPFWYQASARLDCDDLTLIPLRHPEDVVTSTWLRDALARPLGLAVWLESLLDAEQASRGRRRLFVRQDELLTDWRAPLHAIGRRLGHSLSIEDPALAAIAARQLIGARARALEAPLSMDQQGRLGDLAARTWQAALALLRDPSDAAAQGAVDAVRVELRPAFDLFDEVIGALRARTDSRDERANQAQSEREAIRRESTVREPARPAPAGSVEIEVKALRGQVASSETHVAELEKKVNLIEADRERSHDDTSNLKQIVEEIRLEKAALSSDIWRVNKELEELHSTLAARQSEAREREFSNALADVSAQLARARAELDLMRSSISWRVSAPLRALSRSIPAGARRCLRSALQSGWRTLTPWRNAQRRALASAIVVDESWANAPSGKPDDGAAAPQREEAAQPAAERAYATVQVDPEAQRIAHLIRHSDYFDAASYGERAGVGASGIDLALHYVLYGEAQGIMPSDRFDPDYYGERYPDIAAWGGNRLGHYIERGIAEGRYGLPVAATIAMPVDKLDAAKPTVAVLVHEASRTGAPILGWNIARVLKQQVNVVAVVLRAGILEASFESVADAVVSAHKADLFNAVDGFHFGRRLADVYRPLYVIANSVETRWLVPGLADRDVPVVALVHEFSGYTKPVGSLQTLYEQAARVVFPADIVRRSSESDYPLLKLRHSNVLPQGPSEVPKSSLPRQAGRAKPAGVDVREKLRPAGARDALLVVGMGFVDWRKGVDLFVGALTSLVGRDPQADVRFVWVGHGFKVSDALDIASYLAEQVERSGVGNRFAFVDAVENVEDIYAEADILFLSSRLDPLPNVSIDAALRGIPVVCFAAASGMAEILAASQATRGLVVPHLDAGAAAELIGQFAHDRARLRAYGDAIRTLAQERFNMQRYVEAVDRLGREATADMQQEAADVQTILESGAFDAPLFLGARAASVPLRRAVRSYVAQAAKLDYMKLPISGAYTRRPAAGFHPYTYARANAETLGDHTDPFAHYLRAGKPAGPWAHRVIRADQPADEAPSGNLKVALHAHVFYPELVSELLDAVTANQHPCRLIFTTDTEEKAAEINLVTERYRVPADVQLVSNRGRDIAPFLQVLGEVGDHYDVIGHVHGKRSLTTENVASDFGEQWRTFLWQHLIGGTAPMIDRIVHAFETDAGLGLVFPEDPHLIGWEQNVGPASRLAARMGLQTPLPATLDFPVGTMFWARPQALRHLVSLGLPPEDYPEEPLPTDGTILHAIERLITCVVLESGFSYATTYLPQYTR